LRNKRNRAQYHDCETYKLEQKTATDKFHRCCDKLKAKFRNQVETVMDMVASVAMFAMTMMVYVMLRIEHRHNDNQLVKKVKHYRLRLLQVAQWPTKTDCWLSS